MPDNVPKQVVLGISGSIAAYKACEVASLLVKRDVNVTAAMTASAQELVGPASFEGITGNRVITHMFDPVQNTDIEHIAVSTRADLFIVAPATANIVAKAAHGIADDWLSTALLVTRAPILFAPAMNTNMLEHPATVQNIATLQERGCHFIGPESGTLACKTVGPGRMIEPAAIVEKAVLLLSATRDLVGKTVLITSGANHEPIDPVRYIGNRSSGKMGRALAEEALRRGARVVVVTGPADVAPPAAAEVIQVETARQMYDAVMSHAANADIVIGAAAVADYRVEEPLHEKHKRNGGAFNLRLAENPDIIAEVAKRRRNGQVVVGFAAETEAVAENARAKLEKKSLDLIIANEVNSSDSGFGVDTTRAQIIDHNGTAEPLHLMTKEALAHRLFDRLAAPGGSS